ncbi:hypothetical protein ACN38_g11471 [Penicillium nordicum]|uniref:Uncharacterized protein n=1 Tax=Penicillium nordicum TaxID=229535 RepID=A0A0M8NR53_9EURO|nr:hypothetical protein ACN38_g11471 [Penicillium nordicum]
MYQSSNIWYEPNILKHLDTFLCHCDIECLDNIGLETTGGNGRRRRRRRGLRAIKYAIRHITLLLVITSPPSSLLPSGSIYYFYTIHYNRPHFFSQAKKGTLASEGPTPKHNGSPKHNCIFY